jgi:hypothetical protein
MNACSFRALDACVHIGFVVVALLFYLIDGA